MQFTLAIQAIRDMKMRVRRKWNDGFFGKMGLSEGDSGYSMYKRMMEDADEQTRQLDEVEKFLLELQQNKDLLPQLQQASCKAKCAKDGCENEAVHDGYCAAHCSCEA